MFLVPSLTTLSLIFAALGVATNVTELLYVATGLSSLSFGLPVLRATAAPWRERAQLRAAISLLPRPRAASFAPAI
jgi:uncharacterized membrane protein YuzA (DUF378 family)